MTLPTRFGLNNPSSGGQEGFEHSPITSTFDVFTFEGVPTSRFACKEVATQCEITS